MAVLGPAMAFVEESDIIGKDMMVVEMGLNCGLILKMDAGQQEENPLTCVQ